MKIEFEFFLTIISNKSKLKKNCFKVNIIGG